jgi:hypothetical protein
VFTEILPSDTPQPITYEQWQAVKCLFDPAETEEEVA